MIFLIVLLGLIGWLIAGVITYVVATKCKMVKANVVNWFTAIGLGAIGLAVLLPIAFCTTGIFNLYDHINKACNIENALPVTFHGKMYKVVKDDLASNWGRDWQEGAMFKVSHGDKKDKLGCKFINGQGYGFDQASAEQFTKLYLKGYFKELTEDEKKMAEIK
jgi:hypothetical protein